MTHQEEIHVETSGHRDMRDVTGDVARIVKQSGVRAGLVHAFNGSHELNRGLNEPSDCGTVGA